LGFSKIYLNKNLAFNFHVDILLFVYVVITFFVLSFAYLWLFMFLCMLQIVTWAFNKSFENVTIFKHLRKTLTYRNYIH